MRQEPRLSGLLEQIAWQIPGAILCIDREWRISYVNAEGMRLGRLTEEDYAEGTFWDHYPDLVGSDVQREYERVMRTGEPYHAEYWYERFEVWIDLHVLSAEEGIVLYYRDITTQKQTRAERDALQERLEQVLEATTDGVILLDRDFNMVYLNSRAERLLAGRSDLAGSLLGKNLWETFPASVYEGSPYLEHYHRAMRDRVPGEFEAYYPEPLNAWFAVQTRPTEGGISIFFRDVTQQKLDRERLETQHAMLTEAQQAARLAVWEVDPAADSIRFSPESYPVYGWPLESIKTLSDFEQCVLPEHRQRIYEARGRAARTGESVTVEFQCVGANGVPIWIEGRLHVVEGANGRMLLRGLALDIDARKRADVQRESAIRLLDQVMQATTEGVISLNRDWTITYVNPRGKEMVVVLGEHVGRTFWEAFPLAVGTGLETACRNAMEQQVATQFENFYSAEYRRWYRIDIRPAEDGIIAFFRDITLEKTASRRLEQQAMLLADIQQDVRAATWNFDLRSRTLSFHPGSYPVFGRPNEELTTFDAWSKVICWPDRATVEAHLQAVVDSGRTLRHEWQILTRDGARIWVESRSTAIYEGRKAIALRGITTDITAERETRERLARERRTLAFAQQTAHSAAWELNLESRKLSFAEGSYPILGRPNEEFQELEEVIALVPEDEHEKIVREAHEALATGEVMVNEFRVRGPEGQWIWLESRSQFEVVNGKPMWLRGLTIDISQRKLSEEALAASEERYRVLTELNPQALWMGAADGRITYANQGFLDYIGLTLEDLDKWITAFDPADRPSVLVAWAHSVRTGENYDVEARLVRGSDGVSRWWWLRAQPVRDATGAILHWLGVAMDVHDRRTFADALLHKQEETERQRAELEIVYSTAPIGLALFDAVEFRYLQLNERQAQMIGLPKEQILGRTVTEIAPIPGLYEMFEQVAQGRPIINQPLEGELPAQPGVQRYWTVNYFPVHDSDGSIRAISAASLEITQQKRAEEALIQSEKLAAVGRLATSISHEINNPLEAITNLLYLIAGNELPEEARLYVSMAQSELGRVCQIATQTLRFHRQAVGPSYVAAKDLVTPVLNLYQGRLSNSGITVATEFLSTTPIQCFENDIRQVLNNLISNAIDAMKMGGRLIARSHNAVAFDPGCATARKGVRILIVDSGHGMTPEVMRRMYEPFYTTKDLNGTGLGLWISEGIIHRHRGRLAVRSSTDPERHGTVFSLFLPLTEETAD